MLQPIDYRLTVQSPFEAAIQGFKLGQAGLEAQTQQAALEKARADAERTQQSNVAVQALINNPNATAQQYRQVASTLPAEQRKMLEDNFAAMTKEEQASQLQLGGQVMSALVANKPDVAIGLLTSRAQAERNAGREDKAKATESTIEMMRLNPANARHILGISMAGVPGFDEVLKTATAALTPPEQTNLQKEYNFFKETLGPQAAADFLRNRGDPIVNVTFDDGTQYIGSRSFLERKLEGMQQVPPTGATPVAGRAAPNGAMTPAIDPNMQFFMDKAKTEKRMDQSVLDVIRQSFGAGGQQELNNWLQRNNVRVIKRTGRDNATGRTVFEYSDGTVDYGPAN